MERADRIISVFDECGMELSAEKAETFIRFYDFLIDYNRKVNLTAITDFDDAVIKHFADSVLPFTLAPPQNGASFIDVGTGAGFPSIPLLIYRGDLNGTLLEATRKRCDFLTAACDMLPLDAKVVNARAEDNARAAFEGFDLSFARAVAPLPVLCEYCIPYIKQGGYFYALKSVNEELSPALSAIKTLGCETREVKDYSLPGGDKRRLFIIKKISHTPTKYPRNSAAIKKKPL